MKLFFAFIIMIASGKIVYGQDIPTLTALYEREKNVIKLRWQHTDEDVSSYTIQRSSDNAFFSDIHAKPIRKSDVGEFFKFTDDKVTAGKNYYRLKINRGQSSAVITVPVMVIRGNTENKWIVFPVPVGPVLNLQYAGNGALDGVVTVIIQSVSSGIVFTKLRMASTTRFLQIPITNIGKGLYDLRVYVGNNVVWNQRFVK